MTSIVMPFYTVYYHKTIGLCFNYVSNAIKYCIADYRQVISLKSGKNIFTFTVTRNQKVQCGIKSS